jgi:CHRD domain-containing protein
MAAVVDATANNEEDEPMHAIVVRSAVAGLTLAAVIGISSGALAETMTFKAKMDAASSVPPNDSKATGSAEATYDTASKMLTWNVDFSGLTGPATAAHFHGPAEVGKNAPVAVLIANNPTSPAKGSATLTDAQAADLMAGRWYVNVHTMANRGGEIRGWLTK